METYASMIWGLTDLRWSCHLNGPFTPKLSEQRSQQICLWGGSRGNVLGHLKLNPLQLTHERCWWFPDGALSSSHWPDVWACPADCFVCRVGNHGNSIRSDQGFTLEIRKFQGEVWSIAWSLFSALTGFQIQLYLLRALCLWANYLNSVTISYFICQMGVGRTLVHSRAVRNVRVIHVTGRPNSAWHTLAIFDYEYHHHRLPTNIDSVPGRLLELCSMLEIWKC